MSLFVDGFPPNVPIDTIVTGDCRAKMASMPAGWVDLVFADPPFNIDFGYDIYDDAQERSAYLRWAAEWVMGCVRLLRPSGSMFVAIGDEYAAEYKMLLMDAGLNFRNWVIWHYTFGPHQQKKFGRDHAHILYFTRNPKWFTFNADAIRIESQRQRDGDPRANPAGRVPGDVWSFPRLPGNATERTGHPCQMPEAILERVILATTHGGDAVFDPFGGSGTTLAVAKRLGRRFLGCELSAEYARGIRKRLSKVEVA
jgi:DNA modification methylase